MASCLNITMHLPVLLCVLGLLGGPGGVASQEERRLDLPTCLDSFDIHQDKIIRTQDSRAMGAKYINERDVPTREDCLRLCCETQDCDVFVFEEKTPGSCYLFQCGTPEDFKCKFTKHHNYTSAVLVMNRHLTELESQIKHTQHEHELAKLRKPELEPVSSTLSEIPTTTAPGNKEVAAVVPTVAEFAQRSRCSRYQFECHGSGECIAIYNACDGIPQCADGSDEAPELGCPAQAQPSTAAPVVKPEIAAASSNVQQTAVAPSSNQQIYRPSIQTAAQNMPVLSKQFKSNQWTPQMFENQHMGSAAAGGRYAGLQLEQQPQPQTQLQQQPAEYPQPPPELVNQAKQYGREGEGGIYHPPNDVAVQWPPTNYQQEQQMLAYRTANSGGGSQIFSHKGGLMSQPESMNPQYEQIQPEFARYNGYYETPYHKQQQGPNNWHKPHGASLEEAANVPAAPNNLDYYYEENFRTRLQPQMITQRLNAPANVPEPVKLQFKPVAQKGEAEIENQGALLETETDNKSPNSNTSVKKAAAHHPSNNTTTEKPKESHHHPERHHNAHRKVETLSAELSLSENSFESELDGTNVNPRGAILSLTMGLCVTGIMLVLVGCRMRMVRRRMRRGSKSPYAHDADFLVNGMYL
ncbi:low-density lipoprotein receptor-related protein 11 isoform X2 [Macrosteles quadrilineatus]|uniref:low-density lipoprotein receptor-related protein 11 isoform X2 n=1 Tax=Macrosteles quadrilineatus TaxID=74068 RepID=UPI0023E0E700|nr:low-density lipoprotein receptor-related protein 11 isoform X2 [Macrosteles quadrilineatus]